MKITPIEEVDYGIYVWRMPNGQLLANENHDFMMIRSNKGDLSKVKALTEVARSYGIEEGVAEFMSGHRPVTTEEFEEQKQRMIWGLVPDPLDIPALKDEAYAKKNGR